MKTFRDYDIDLEEDGYDDDWDDEVYEDQEVYMYLNYGLYMAEAEGYLNTKESCKQRMLRDIRYKYNMGHDKLTIDESYLADFGLTFDDLTKSDYTRIDKVARTGRLT